MAQPNDERVTCPCCGHGYRWQAALAGRTVPCKKCNQPFIVPEAPGVGLSLEPEPVNDEGIYELDIKDEPDPQPASANTPAAGTHDGKCPVCNTPLREGAVICMNCGYNLQDGSKIQTDVAAAPVDADAQAADADREKLTATDDPGKTARRQQYEAEVAADLHREHQFIEVKLPVILLCVGFFLTLLNNLVLLPMTPSASDAYNLSSGWEVRLAAMIESTVGFGINAVIMFAGLMVVLLVFGTALGNLFTLLLKIAAIIVFSAAAIGLVYIGADFATGGYGWVSFIFNWAIYLGLMIYLCWRLLDLDGAEIHVLIASIIVGKFAANWIAVFVISLIL